MEDLKNFTNNLYKVPLMIRMPLLAICFILLFIVKSQIDLIRMTKPLLIVISLYLIMLTIVSISQMLSSYFIRKNGIVYPSTMLWLYPTVSFLLILFIAFFILKTGNTLAGRGFWSSYLELTSQDATQLFSTTFMAMIAFISFQFISATVKCMHWFTNKSKSHMSAVNNSISKGLKKDILDTTFGAIKKENNNLKIDRNKATSFNKRSFIFIIFGLIIFSYLFTVYNPALILYYRAKIQLKSFLHPEIAIKTLEHLLRKYPQYKYKDSVEFCIAWITDRRLKQYNKALKMYIKFVQSYNNTSPWIDEAIANIIRIYSDKLVKPTQTIKWAKIFQKQFQSNILAPQVTLYQIRALKLLNNNKEANRLIDSSLIKYKNQPMQVINLEDHMVERLPFKKALEL